MKVDPPDDEFSQFPVESIARFLAVCGNEDPALLRRSMAPPAVVDLAQVHIRLPPPLHSPSSPSPPSDGTSDQSGYLEELVAIAVSSARQAEDSLQQIRAANATARGRLLLSISALGAIALVLGIVRISTAGFGLDISGLFSKGGNKFASVAEHQSPVPGAIVVGHRPPITVRAPQPPSLQLSEGPHDLAMMPRAAEPSPLALAPAQAAPATLTEHQSLEAMLHQNAARDAGAMDGAPVPVRQLRVSPDPSHVTQIWSAPAEPRRDAPSASAAVRVRAVAPSNRRQLVAAMQALDALTGPADEPDDPP